MLWGALAGPPCDTWSQANLLQDKETAQHRAPRVLRDLDSIWGRISLALRELQQLDIGNLLLLFTIELLLHLALADGICCLEHPAEPKDSSKASIWRFPLIVYMLAWPGFDFVEIAQGLWGARSKKPTGLMLLNMSAMIPQLRSWQSSAAIGLTSEGVWATRCHKCPEGVSACFVFRTSRRLFPHPAAKSGRCFFGGT